MATLQKQQLLAISGLACVIAFTYLSYLPGMGGLFIFDDFPNLSTLGQYHHLSTWDNFWLFLLEGDSGPSGRPISLASFFLNDTAWPSSPSSFTHTNILIHLLNGILIYWFVFLLCKTFEVPQSKSIIVAIFGTAFWILHPLHSNTVLYIIQRMTELSALFTLSAIIFYLYGRKALVQDKPQKATYYLLFGVGFSVILALLSKENAILFSAYILAIEYFLFAPLGFSTPKYLKFWLVPFVVLPFLGLLTYLLNRGFGNIGYTDRDFNAYERLLTEARVLFDYLHHILIPHVGNTSLFHDDYIISRSLLNPWTTLPSVIGIFILIVATFTLRKKLPVVAFAIAWFLGGHLLESTTLSLELYFEHRNYLPMFGFAFAGAWYVAHTTANLKALTMIGGMLIILLLAFLSHSNATLWGKPKELIANWQTHHPHSLRVQEAYKVVIGEPEYSIKTALPYNNNKGMQTYLSLKNLTQKCQFGQLTSSEILAQHNIFQNKKVTASSINALDELMNTWLLGKCPNISETDLSAFLQIAIQNQNDVKNSTFIHMTHYWLYYIYAKQKKLSLAMHNLEAAYEIKPSVELLLLQAKVLSSAGLHNEALERLRDTSMLQKTYKKKMILNIRQKEITRLIESIKKRQ